jgi:beta-lactamase regulating signal transducer with metallopeptidase domain
MVADSIFWWRLVWMLAMQSACVIGIAWLMTRRTRSAAVSRFIWRAAMICLLVVCVATVSGVGQIGAGFLKTRGDEIPQGPSPALQKHVTATPTRGRYATVSWYSFTQPDMRNIVWWPGAVWLFGIVAVLIRLTFAHGLLVVLRRRSARVSDGVLLREVSTVADLFRVRRSVLLVEAHEATAPFTFGFFRPTIVLPARFIENFQPTERKAMLTHEMAHVAAADSIWNCAADILSALLWWHPMVWLARKRLHDVAELAADEALVDVENGPETLASCLVAMGRRITGSWWHGTVGMRGTDGGSNLRKRVERLLELRRTGLIGQTWRWRLGRWVGTALLLVVVVLAGGWAQEKSASVFGEQPDALWRNSPMAVVLRTMAGAVPRPVSFVAELVRNGRAEYENGHLSEAARELNSALIMEPNNKAAKYYLDLAKEAMRRNKMSGWTEPGLIFPTLPPKPAKLGVEIAQANTEPAKSSTRSSSETAPPANTEKLYTKMFHLKRELVVEKLKASGGAVSNVKSLDETFRRWLKERGVNLSSINLFFDDRHGQLLVQATSDELDKIESAVEFLNGGKEWPQVTLAAAILEIDSTAEAVLKSNGLDLSRAETVAPDKSHKLLEALSKAEGATVISTPKVSTLSGRQANVTIEEGQSNVARAGVSVDFLPSVETDRHSIHLVTFFWPTGERQPVSKATARATSIVQDGETLVFASPQVSGKRHVVFITVVITDAFGQPVNRK